VAHLDYLREIEKEGRLRASGPFTDTPGKTAMLILSAPDREDLMALIARDPFEIHGLIEDMTVNEWDPIFGVFNDESTMPGRFLPKRD